jgi:dipeptidyl aminopeptidase/acylaminoacyl peptidase
MEGGDPIRLTNLSGGVSAFEWSPSGNAIAVLAGNPPSEAARRRREMYGGDFEVLGTEVRNNHLWLVPLPLRSGAAPPAELILGDSLTLDDFAWSPDGGRIAFDASPSRGGSIGAEDIYVVDVATRAIHKLVGTPGTDDAPMWSPDGKSIVFRTANGNRVLAATKRIAIIGANGGPVRVISEKFDENPMPVCWCADGIYFRGAQRTAMPLFRIDPVTKVIERLSDPDWIVSAAAFDRSGTTLAISASRPNTYPEIYLTPLRRFKPRVLTSLGDQVKSLPVARREVVSWRSTDGTQIEGVLLKPAQFDSTKKYPLLVVIHGGPTLTDLPNQSFVWSYPVEEFVGLGAVVLKPNYRGSAGYGEAFRSLNTRNLGVGDTWDVVSGVDYLIGRGFVDSTRVGAMGWSQGGFITAFASLTTNKFRAVAVGGGVSDWTLYYGYGDSGWWVRSALNATPWEDPAIYQKVSPMTYVKGAHTPTLILHGELDRRAPTAGAYELYAALRDQHVPVQMIVYKSQGHGIGAPKLIRALHEHSYKWFKHWIWGTGVPTTDSGDTTR